MQEGPYRLTAEQRTHIQQLIAAMRTIAEPVGPLHGFWEWIFELDALARGVPRMLDSTETETIAQAEAALKRKGMLKASVVYCQTFRYRTGIFFAATQYPLCLGCGYRVWVYDTHGMPQCPAYSYYDERHAGLWVVLRQPMSGRVEVWTTPGCHDVHHPHVPVQQTATDEG